MATQACENVVGVCPYPANCRTICIVAEARAAELRPGPEPARYDGPGAWIPDGLVFGVLEATRRGSEADLRANLDVALKLLGLDSRARVVAVMDAIEEVVAASEKLRRAFER